jgi:hypothetical protein
MGMRREEVQRVFSGEKKRERCGRQSLRVVFIYFGEI